MSIHLDGRLEDGGGDVDFPNGISLLGEELSDLGNELYLREQQEKEVNARAGRRPESEERISPVSP